jgi:hypothetical protein
VVSPRQQGDLGEASAIEWLVGAGYAVFVPIGHSPDCDLVALRDGVPLRVQVKTSTCFRAGRWCVMLATRGGNRSWSGVVKRFDPSRYDALFVLSGDGRRWFVPATDIGGASSINLGGPKYAAFEVAPGRPIVSQEDRCSLDSVAARRDTEAVKRVRL